MLFARAYFQVEYMVSVRQSIEHQIGEDLLRGYSFWDGDYDPTLPQHPGLRTFEELGALLTETEKGPELPPLSRGGILPGLCAFCAAETHRELARKIWDQYHEQHRRLKLDGEAYLREPPPTKRPWIYFAIFESEPAGFDAEGWPLFRTGKLLAIAEVNAIIRESEAKPTASGLVPRADTRDAHPRRD